MVWCVFALKRTHVHSAGFCAAHSSLLNMTPIMTTTCRTRVLHTFLWQMS